MNQDSLRIEIRDIKEAMQGISPKTSTYQELAIRLAGLEARLKAGTGAPMRKIPRNKERLFHTVIHRPDF